MRKYKYIFLTITDYQDSVISINRIALDTAYGIII